MLDSEDKSQPPDPQPEHTPARYLYELIFVRPWDSLSNFPVRLRQIGEQARDFNSVRAGNRAVDRAPGPDNMSKAAQPGINASRQIRIFAWLQRNRGTIFEFLILFAWAIIIGREYLNFDPDKIPFGREFSSAVQSHHLWTRFKECGWCALWNGTSRGGFPSVVDLLGSALHPLVVITTLFMGVVNGAKLSLVIAFFLAGLAQWWLGKELELGTAARVFGALLVMPAGHLSGKMELGVFSIVLSTAMVSFAFPALIRVTRTTGTRPVVLLAIVLASLAVSGQGYIQAGFILTIPTILILVGNDQIPAAVAWRRLLTAGVLGALLAAPFLVPLAHFWPNFVKDSDPAFVAAQPFSFYLVNLVVGDFEFLSSTILQKLPYPHLYTLYIGWIPFILAAIAMPLAEKKHRRVLWYLLLTALLALWVGSTQPVKLLYPLIHWFENLRFAPIIGGIAVPALIGLASYSVDKILAYNYPKISLFQDESEQGTRNAYSLKWLLIIPAGIALFSLLSFSKQWIYTISLGNNPNLVLDALETDSAQWVQPPFGEHFFIELAVARGMKLSPGILNYHWRDRDVPQAQLEANRSGPPTDEYQQIGTADGIPIYANYENQYAEIIGDNDRTPCSAIQIGGWIDVSCRSDFDGRLIVKENMWSGWYVWRDGAPVRLEKTEWLETAAPAGEHTYRFRYIPWDVPAGILMMVIGIVVCAVVWRREDGEDR